MTLESSFDTMITAAYPNGISIAQKQDLKKAFFAGVITTMTSFRKNSTHPDKTAECLTSISKEIKDYAKELKMEMHVFDVDKTRPSKAHLN